MNVQSKPADAIFRIRQYSTENLTPDWYCGFSLGDGKYAKIPAPSTHCKDSIAWRLPLIILKPGWGILALMALTFWSNSSSDITEYHSLTDILCSFIPLKKN